MSSKPAAPLGNAAEKLKFSRPMPAPPPVPPLPREGAPAVTAAPAKPKAVPQRRDRPDYSKRLTTYMTEEGSERFDRLVALFKRKYGRRFAGPDVIDKALKLLEANEAS